MLLVPKCTFFHLNNSDVSCRCMLALVYSVTDCILLSSEVVVCILWELSYQLNSSCQSNRTHETSLLKHWYIHDHNESLDSKSSFFKNFRWYNQFIIIACLFNSHEDRPLSVFPPSISLNARDIFADGVYGYRFCEDVYVPSLQD